MPCPLWLPNWQPGTAYTEGYPPMLLRAPMLQCQPIWKKTVLCILQSQTIKALQSLWLCYLVISETIQGQPSLKAVGKPYSKVIHLHFLRFVWWSNSIAKKDTECRGTLSYVSINSKSCLEQALKERQKQQVPSAIMSSMEQLDPTWISADWTEGHFSPSHHHLSYSILTQRSLQPTLLHIPIHISSSVSTSPIHRNLKSFKESANFRFAEDRSVKKEKEHWYN